MNVRLFDTLPDAARIWIHAANRDLTSEEQRRAVDMLSDFVAGWSSHGRRVEADAAVVADRFIVIAAHLPGGDISGCGIDASVHALASIAESLNFEWAPALDIFYSDDESVKQLDRPSFSSLASKGRVTGETLVYDTSLTTLGDWRRGVFELPARESWHARAFRLEETIA